MESEQRKNAIRGAYHLTGSNNFYDGMITCSTFSGKAVCRMVWAMNRQECEDYLSKALSGIPEDTKVNVITREQRQRLVELFKHFPVSVIGTRPIDEAIITSGGVSLKEVNPRTMGSKLVPGLYFAGEVLDLDAYTGGYNLQIAFCTAQSFANHLE